MTSRNRFGLGLLVLLSFACAGPGERTERGLDLELPEAWASGEKSEPLEGVDTTWWRELVDDELLALVDEALEHNVDLRASAALMFASEASARVEGAAGLPDVSVGLDRNRTKRNFIGFPTGGGGGGGGVAVSRSTTFELALSTRWEVDLWDRLGSRERAAQEESFAAWADHEFAKVSLAGAVIRTWYELVEAQKQVELALKTQQTWSASADLIKGRYTGGLSPALDARLVLVELERATAERVRLERLQSEAARTMELLLGRYPKGELEAAGDLLPPREQVPAGLPASLIGRRADLFAAERRLVAAEARVDASRASFYPSLVLTGAVGTSSTKLSDLLDGDFGVWRLLGSLVQPLFEGGRLRAELDISDATAEAQLARFAGLVLAALAEVENALAAESSLDEELKRRSAVADHAQHARDLARERYSQGLSDVSTWLDAQRTAYVAESSLIRLRRLRLTSRVRLHLALGGGFSAPEQPGQPGSREPQSDAEGE